MFQNNCRFHFFYKNANIYDLHCKLQEIVTKLFSDKFKIHIAHYFLKFSMASIWAFNMTGIWAFDKLQTKSQILLTQELQTKECNKPTN
jgi:hypothetical protein